jgi:3-oxocholest-4-en-26-oate---CoA ligase
MSNWNFAEVWDRIGRDQPELPAVTQGSRTIDWGQFHGTSAGFGTWLIGRGVRPGAKVASYLHNSPEYLVSVYGALWASTVPVNTNYRYGAAELVYLFTNADAEVLVFHGTFTAQVDEIRGDCPALAHYLHVDDGTGPCPPWATPFGEACATTPGTPPPRSGDDLLFLYTGGTTGVPKGVMWRQDDIFARLNFARVGALAPDATNEGFADAVAAERPGGTCVPACPLMHGTGLFGSITTLSQGGQIALLASRHYDPAELAETIDAHAAQIAVIVGDPFARPLARLLEADPTRYSLKSLAAIVSSGAMWSEEIKRVLLNHHPHMLLVDAFSSSEALGMGMSVSTGDAAERTARFTLGENVRVVTDDGVEVTPGSELVGKLMLGGRNPLGYYKDQAKTDETFRTLNGQRYSVPGDMAMVNADGTIQLLGRGNQCINTAGEKVYPEEVEEALKTHPAVADACVVGVPDERFGQCIVAAVELRAGADTEPHALIDHVRGQLAHYKAPRAVRFVATIGRAPNGKLDYGRHQREMAAWVAAGV